MSSDKHKKQMKHFIESISVLEDKIETVNNKINNTEKQILKLTRFLKRKKITNRKQNTYKSTVTVLTNSLNVLNNSKTERVT